MRFSSTPDLSRDDGLDTRRKSPTSPIEDEGLVRQDRKDGKKNRIPVGNESRDHNFSKLQPVVISFSIVTSFPTPFATFN
jgi:hypothetical protein